MGGINTRRPGMPILSLSTSSSASLASMEMDQDPHTPLPLTPLPLSDFFPIPSMSTTPTPSSGTFPDLFLSSSFTSLSSSASSPPSTSSKRARDDTETPETWSEREDGILESFLLKPLRALSTPYPPGTLPPPAALDELTSQVMHFHRAPVPSTGMSASPSLPSLSTTAEEITPDFTPTKKGHSRSRSLCTQPWTHTWTSTRQRIFKLARAEAIGGVREDRWKGRQQVAIPDRVVPGGEVVRRGDGVLELRRNGSFGGLVIQEEEVGEMMDMEMDGGQIGEKEKAGKQQGKKLGQVLRLSTSLQRSSRVAPMTPAGPTSSPVVAPVATPVHRLSVGSVQRPASLLQRGKSFTAEDFDTYMTLSSSPPRSSPPSLDIDMDIDPITDRTSTPTNLPSLAADINVTPTKTRPSPFADYFSMINPSPSSSSDGTGPSTPSPERSFGVMPHDQPAPFITLTQTSPSPEKTINRGWDFNTSPTRSNRNLFTDLTTLSTTKSSKPRPPPLQRSFSSSAGHETGPSAFAEFMTSNRPTTQFLANQPFPTTIGSQDPLAVPVAKRQRVEMRVVVPPKNGLGVGMGVDESGLRSPFDEVGKRF